ncbi:UNVERIFIED_CONTAM: hypothetical protein FKN15_011347 [Acipenser sinensis]
MDVSVSVSFLQDELASTIEHAVKAAVDTVLCEITKVVGGKFTEFQMEMAGKEKENESLKLRLEISESELKAVRECLSAADANIKQALMNMKPDCNEQDVQRNENQGLLTRVQEPEERPASSEEEEGPVIEDTQEEISDQEWCVSVDGSSQGVALNWPSVVQGEGGWVTSARVSSAHRASATPVVRPGACGLACKLPRAALFSDAVALRRLHAWDTLFQRLTPSCSFFPGSLKAVLSSPPHNNTLDLSGIPLTVKDMDRLVSYLQQNARLVTSVELCFTELTDEAFLQLLPTLSALPLLNTLSVNGNWLTKAVLRDIIDTLKDLEMFPSITWIDLGNNVDIFSLPQPFLVSLRKRCPKQGNLPTIMEFGESQVSDLENHDGNRSESLGDLDSEEEDLRENSLLFAGQSETDSVEKRISSVETGDHMTALAANQT